MSEFNIQSEFALLRKEIQTDRLALQTSISEGFEKMHEKFDEHAIGDEKRFGLIEGRLNDVEETSKTVKKGFWWSLGMMITTAIGWIGSLWLKV